jgi:hypothetical protein
MGLRKISKFMNINRGGRLLISWIKSFSGWLKKLDL